MCICMGSKHHVAPCFKAAIKFHFILAVELSQIGQSKLHTLKSQGTELTRLVCALNAKA